MPTVDVFREIYVDRCQLGAQAGSARAVWSPTCHRGARFDGVPVVVGVRLLCALPLPATTGGWFTGVLLVAFASLLRRSVRTLDDSTAYSDNRNEGSP